MGGNTIVNFEGGVALGSVFGGGHNGSVGTHLVDVDNPNYGKMKHDVVDDPATPDVDESETHGHITLNITGGIIGNPYEHVEEPVGGNVFGGCEGSATSPLWKKLARAKQTEVHITGSPVIKGSVFGGPEQGTIVIDTIKDGSGDIVRLDGGNAHVLIEGGTIGSMFNTASAITGNDTTLHVGGSVFGGGKGVILADKDFSGIVMRNTTVDIQGGRIYYNIYGGGEMASVGLTRDSIASASGNHYHVPVMTIL